MENNPFYPLTVLQNRLERLEIKVEFIINVPWIYLGYINGVRVKEKTEDSEHGFNIAWLPVRADRPFIFTNTKEMFDLIRKYGKQQNI